MGFGQRVKKDLELALQEGANLIKEGTALLGAQASVAAKKGAASLKSETQRLTKLGQVRFQLFQLNRQAQDNFTKIGSKVYELASDSREELKINEPLRKLIADTQAIEKQIKTLEAKAKKLSP
jgi:cell shape-determining protein MreC